MGFFRDLFNPFLSWEWPFDDRSDDSAHSFAAGVPDDPFVVHQDFAEFNPASGLPMLDGSGMDIMGNAMGSNFMDDPMSSIGMGWDMGTSVNHGIGSGGFDWD